jgi:hypothetical protein
MLWQHNMINGEHAIKARGLRSARHAGGTCRIRKIEAGEVKCELHGVPLQKIWASLRW